MPTAEEQLAVFISRYLPEIADQFEQAHLRVRALLPGAVEMVYDNYNALVIGFSPNTLPSHAILSIASYPRYVTLFIMGGESIPDPTGRLEGTAKTVRGIRLSGPETLDEPDVVAIINWAVEKSVSPFETEQPNRLIIQSISAKQRPRLPSK